MKKGSMNDAVDQRMNILLNLSYGGGGP